MKIFLRLCPIFVSICVGAAASADQVDDFIRAEMASRQVPGLALKVVQKGKPIKAAAYGMANLELNVPVELETVFEIGSITKQFTAGSILLLMQDGRLALTNRINRFLTNTPSTWSDITILHLMTHTSGLRNYTGLPGFELTRHLTQEKFIEAMAKQPQGFRPGESWAYCNTGFNLLGYIIENVSGKSFWDFMNERIFKPLEMTNTTDRLPKYIIPHRADGYEKTNHILINRDYDLTDVFAAGAIVSTVGDLAKWDAALDGDKLFSPASKAMMWKPITLNDGSIPRTKYGLGWFLDPYEGHTNIGHSGSTSGFSASNQRFPDDELCVIVLTNTDETVATELARRIAKFYFAKPSASR